MQVHSWVYSFNKILVRQLDPKPFPTRSQMLLLSVSSQKAAESSFMATL